MCRICPKCGGIAEFNAYYERVTCTRCSWESEKTNIKDSQKYCYVKTENDNIKKTDKEKVLAF